MPLSAQNPQTVAITAANYRYSISINSSVNAAKQLVVSGVVNFQRCAVDGSGNYTDDPTPGSCQSYAIGDLTQFVASNPTLATLLGTAWASIDAFVDAINQANKLV
jgi:hypothetical protein